MCRGSGCVVRVKVRVCGEGQGVSGVRVCGEGEGVW